MDSEELAARLRDCETDFAALEQSFAVAFRAVWEMSSADRRTRDALDLLLKLHFHAASAFHLAHGVPISGTAMPDMPSVFVLCRAAFETFLTFYHVFADRISTEESDCRYQGWVLASLLRRQRYSATLDETKLICEADRRSIAEIEKLLGSNPCYQGLSKEKKKALRYSGKTSGWSDIAKSAGLRESHATEWYDFVCGYAHSGAASIVQIRQADELQLMRMICTGLEVVLISMAFMVEAFVGEFPQGRPALEGAYIDAVGKWRYVGLERHTRAP